MQVTNYVAWMHKFSGKHPKDSFDWVDTNSPGKSGLFDYPVLSAKLPNQSTWRPVTHLGHSPFGLGIRTDRVMFQSRLPELTWAWDELSFIKRSRFATANLIETNCFSIGFAMGTSDEAPLRILAIVVTATAFSRFVSGQNPPLIESPIPEGVLAAEGLTKYYSNGFPRFTQQTANDYAQIILSSQASKKNEFILMPDS